MSDKILRWPQVVEKVGLSRTTLWRMAKEGEFPSPITLVNRMVGFPETVIDEWIEQRKKAARRKRVAQGIGVPSKLPEGKRVSGDQ